MTFETDNRTPKDCHFYGFYTCGKGLFSKTILWQNYKTLKYDGTQVTHCGLILAPDKSLITPDSLVFESTIKYGGVRFTTLKQIMARDANLSVTEFAKPVSRETYNKMVATTQRIEGLPYDKKGILGLATGENWQEEDMFFCSEAKSFALMKSGYDDIDWSKYDLSRIPPKEVRSWPQNVIKLNFI